MVVDYLHDDTDALKVCAESARCFLPATRYHLFQRITLNSAERMDSCLDMLSGKRPDDIIRSTRALDIGFKTHWNAWRGPQIYWEKMAEICLGFGRLGKINSIWFSDVNFSQIAIAQRSKLLEALSLLVDTVTELGIYECFFYTIQDFGSVICTFSYCDHLFIRGCAYDSGVKAFSSFHSFPKNYPSIVELSIEHFSFRSLADVAAFITPIKTEHLKWLYCDIDHYHATRAILKSASHSLECLEFSHSEYADVFHS
jgi:hypothetical protein